MASARREFVTLETWAIATLVDEPDAPSHLVGWYMEGAWIATVLVRRAADQAVLLMAIPGECVSQAALPWAPSGGLPTASVAATSGRGKCKVAFLAVPEEELQDGCASTPGGKDTAFQQVIKSVLQKKVFNEEHRKRMSQFAQKYTAGMSMAAKRHGLTPDCLAVLLVSFCPWRV